MKGYRPLKDVEFPKITKTGHVRSILMHKVDEKSLKIFRGNFDEKVSKKFLFKAIFYRNV